MLTHNGTLSNLQANAKLFLSAEYWDALLNSEELPTVYMDMKFKHYDSIKEEREEALRNGQLDVDRTEYVPAQFRFKDQVLSVKMRLKGRLESHWNTDQWSYDVKMKGDDRFFGMERFSIQHPKTRNYLFEWLWLKHLRMEDLLGVPFKKA